MSQDANKMTCEEFQSQLDDLINTCEDVEDQPHVKACVTCRKIVQDLEMIAEEARKRGEWSDVPWWPR
jgi:hypothetical protein